MRKLTLLISFCILSLGVLNAQNSAKKLPSDSWMVFSFNFQNLHKKIDIDRVKRLEMVEYGYNMMKREFGEDSSVIKKIYDDPKNYGVNLEPSARFFMRLSKDEDDDYKFSPGLLVNLSKSKKFEKLLKVFFDKGDEWKDFLEVKNGYKVFKAKGMAIVWTKTNAYFLNIERGNRDTIDDDIVSLMNPKNSLITNKSYVNSSISKNDLSYWLDYEKYMAYAKDLSKDDKNNLFDFDINQIKGLESTFSFNFAKGAVLLNSISEMNESMTEDYKKIYSKKINPAFFQQINGDSLVGMASGAIDINELRGFLETKYEKVLDTLEHTIERSYLDEVADSNEVILSLKEKLDSTVSYVERRELRDSIKTIKDSIIDFEMTQVNSKIDSTLGEFNLSREEAWDFFTGDFMIASSGVYTVIDTVETYEYVENEDGEYVYAPVESTKEVPTPLFLAMATVNLTDKCTYALEKLDEEGIIEKEEGKNYYNLTVSKYDYYIFMHDDILTYTNDKSLVDMEHKKGISLFESKVKKPVLTNALASNMYGFVDINRVMALVPKDESSKKHLEKIENRFDNVEFISKITPTGKSVSKLAWNFIDKEDNSLHNLLDLANDYFKIFNGQ